jgi:hypothetical protein
MNAGMGDGQRPESIRQVEGICSGTVLRIPARGTALYQALAESMAEIFLELLRQGLLDAPSDETYAQTQPDRDTGRP